MLFFCPGDFLSRQDKKDKNKSESHLENKKFSIVF
jgi:hypothetical protein